MHRNGTESISLAEVHRAELGFTQPRGILEHGLEYRLQLAGRAADDPKHLRGGRLLLQCLGKPLLRLGKLVGPLVELLLELGGGTATTFCG